MSARSAWLTASAVGKAAATSGASTTTFVPSAYRFAYLPRSPWLKSYSPSMSGSRFGLVALFIILTLPPRRLTSTDQSNPLTSIREDDHEQSAVNGLAH